MSTILQHARELAQGGDYASAEKKLVEFFAQLLKLNVKRVEIRRDHLSLNSVNGWLHLESSATYPEKMFFKYHQEEGEGKGVAEYYNAQLLQEHGFPVEMPLLSSQQVGEQVLLYAHQQAPRLADACHEAEYGQGDFTAIVQAQQALDQKIAENYLRTLHMAQPEQCLQEPLHQLFYWRLVDALDQGNYLESNTEVLRGRAGKFYQDQEWTLPDGTVVTHQRLALLKWIINGKEYPLTLSQAFAQAVRQLNPHLNRAYPAVVAHGDAHNGNVWFHQSADAKPALTLFDPAFAGRHVPALLAEVKPTFHNIFAHPRWLYEPRMAQNQVSVQLAENQVLVEHDWKLTPLRQAFLTSKLSHVWKPLLQEMKKREWLQEDWESYVRTALFCCPTLVLNLRAGAGSVTNAHTPSTSFLGLALSIMLASPPKNAEDDISKMIKEIL
jgi:hypothetical protein